MQRIAMIAAADAETMSDRLAALNPDRMPSQRTIGGWISSADKLAS